MAAIENIFSKKDPLNDCLLPGWKVPEKVRIVKTKNSCIKLFATFLIGLYIGSTLAYIIFTSTSFFHTTLPTNYEGVEAKLKNLEMENDMLKTTISNNNLVFEHEILVAHQEFGQKLAELDYELDIISKYYSKELEMAYKTCASNMETCQKNLAYDDLSVPEIYTGFDVKEMKVLNE